MPADSARPAKVLSIPNTTSPRGESLDRINWLTTVPASPGATTLTVIPVDFSNCVISESLSVNESWATTVSVVPARETGAELVDSVELDEGDPDTLVPDDALGLELVDIVAGEPDPHPARVSRPASATTARRVGVMVTSSNLMEGPATMPGRWSRLPTPVRTGSGPRVCAGAHSQRPDGAPLSVRSDASSRTLG
jgi:hypothetical protein